MKKDKKIVEYYQDERMLFRLGKVNYTKAHRPLTVHTHEDMTEFVFLIKGCQIYSVEEKSYKVNSGDIFVARPGEWHSTGGNPEDKASLYYLIIDLKNVIQSGVICDKSEAQGFISHFEIETGRIYQGNDQMIGLCKEIMEIMLSPNKFYRTRIRNALSSLMLLMTACPAKYEENIMENMQEQIEDNIEDNIDDNIEDNIDDKKEESEEKKERKDKKEKKDKKEEKQMKEVLQYIENHIKDDIKIEELAKQMALSVSRFHFNFVKATGIPPREYILRRKIESAKNELWSSDRTVTEIAYEYGFSSSQYFATVFKRFCYMSPLDYRCSAESHHHPL